MPYYSRDLPDPQKALDVLGFDQPSIIYDRTGKVELARLGERKREVVTFDQIPPEVLDATTAIEDKDFWINPGFDLGGFISATVDTLRASPAAAPRSRSSSFAPASCPPTAFAGSLYERKIREIIQSIRLTQAYPGQDGKQQIITAYLNQNFYGNQSYGVAAAAKSYFNKELKDLTLSEAAILAAIPQSPTQYDLVKNATIQCTIEITPDQTCPAANTLISVPQDSEIVIRRNKVLDLMETRSSLSGKNHTVAEYEAAKADPVVLSPQGSTPWKAPQFVWQVRHQLGGILCGPANADTCEKVDTGGYKIITTLDWKMQQTVEKWLYAAARVPHLANAGRQLDALKIPAADQKWILGLKKSNIFNAAGGIVDYRTGQVLAYGGSAAYYGTGDVKFQPQYDVLSDGFRQPGSAIKPINYITGIDDGTMTAATMFMDVVTDFGGPFTPTQADKLERGPVRLREALQFSLNVPSIKAGLINGLDHLFQRMKDFGLSFPSGMSRSPRCPSGRWSPSDRPDRGVRGDREWRRPHAPADDHAGPGPERQGHLPDRDHATGRQAGRQRAGLVHHHRHPVRQHRQASTPTGASGRSSMARRAARRPTRRARPRTTRTSRPTATSPRPTIPRRRPSSSASGWATRTPRRTMAACRSTPRPRLWSPILTEVSKGLPLAQFARPAGLVDATVDAFSGLLPGPYTTKTVKELFVEGTVPTQRDNYHTAVNIDSATGKLWKDGCTGPMVTHEYLDFSKAEPAFPQWQTYTKEWAARAARGVGVRGGPATR